MSHNPLNNSLSLEVNRIILIQCEPVGDEIVFD